MVPLDLVGVLVSLGVPFLLERLKREQWAVFIHQHAPVINRVTAVAVAVLTSLGVRLAFDADLGVLTVSGLIPDDMLRLGAQAAANLLAQESAYRRFVQEPRAPRGAA